MVEWLIIALVAKYIVILIIYFSKIYQIQSIFFILYKQNFISDRMAKSLEIDSELQNISSYIYMYIVSIEFIRENKCKDLFFLKI